MLKSYLHSFISMKYIFVLPGLGILIFLLAFAFFGTHLSGFRIAAIAAGGVLLVLMVLFYGERALLGRKLDHTVKNWKEYNDSWIIGQAFLLEERMLVYDKKLHEFHYEDLRKVSGEEARGGRCRIVFTSDADQACDICSSRAQAERLAAFLKKKNPSIALEGIEPKGDGLIQHIESGRDAPVI